VHVVYVDNFKTSAAKLKEVIVTDRPGGVVIKQDAFHFIKNITDTANPQHSSFQAFNTELSSAVMKLYAPDMEAVQAANPTASTEELLKLFKQCRRQIPEGPELWARMTAVMEKFIQVGPDAEDNILFNGSPDTVAVFLNQKDMVLAGAVTGVPRLHGSI
jgi:cytochrome c1